MWGRFIAPSITNGATIPLWRTPGDKGDRFPMSVWDRCNQSLAAQAAASEPQHIRASGIPFARDVAFEPRHSVSTSHNGAAHVALERIETLGPCDI
jgi:hypothetical protein